MIKYRACDKLEKRIRKVVSLHWQGDKLVAVKVEGEAEPLPVEGRFVVEQYTGLKDKNGVEIYEGDIVVDSDDNIEAVIRCYGAFDPVSYYKDEIMTIIGNIHENAELLEM